MVDDGGGVDILRPGPQLRTFLPGTEARCARVAAVYVPLAALLFLFGLLLVTVARRAKQQQQGMRQQ